MALTQRLEIRQSHALVMTPQLMQAIKLLQLSNLDLGAYVDNELERNPLLERGEAEPEGSPVDGDGEDGPARETESANRANDSRNSVRAADEEHNDAGADLGIAGDDEPLAPRAN